MDSYLAQLAHADPAVRRNAVLALMRRAEDGSADINVLLSVFARAYRAEQDADVKSVLAKAGKRLQELKAAVPHPQTSSPTQADRQGLKHLPDIQNTLKGAEHGSGLSPVNGALEDNHPLSAGDGGRYKTPSKDNSSGVAPEKSRRSSGFPISAVLLIAALIALGVVLVLFGRQAWEAFLSRVGVQPPAVTAVMGRVETYYSYVLALEYQLLIPEGEPPDGGWRAVVAFHGQGGRGEDMIAVLGPRLSAERILLIAPSFRDAGQGTIMYDDYTNDALNEMLDEVYYQHAPYNVSAGGPVLTGFSAGATVAALFAADNAPDLAGVHLMGLPIQRQGPLPLPARRDLFYRLTVGEFDERLDSSSQYASRLQGQGNPVVFEIITGSGHVVAPAEVDALVDVVNQQIGNGG
jgi:predicted esterase